MSAYNSIACYDENTPMRYQYQSNHGIYCQNSGKFEISVNLDPKSICSFVKIEESHPDFFQGTLIAFNMRMTRSTIKVMMYVRNRWSLKCEYK